MNWYYANSGVQSGPVDDNALADLVRQGVIRYETLVWRDGMANWQPYGVVQGAQSAHTVAFPPSGTPGSPGSSFGGPTSGSGTGAASGSGGSAYGSAPGSGSTSTGSTPTGSTSASGSVPFDPGAAPQPAYAPAAVAPGPVQPGIYQAGLPVVRRYGGFWIRFLARLIDGIILGCVGLIFQIPVWLMVGGSMATLGDNPDPAAVMAMLPVIFLPILLSVALGVVYEVYFLTTRAATLGKLALGLKVIRQDGAPITTGLALGRYFAGMLSSAIMQIGNIIAGFDSEKRALHDHLCGTRVIYSK